MWKSKYSAQKSTKFEGRETFPVPKTIDYNYNIKHIIQVAQQRQDHTNSTISASPYKNNIIIAMNNEK